MMKKKLFSIALSAVLNFSVGTVFAAPSIDVGFSPEGSVNRHGFNRHLRVI